MEHVTRAAGGGAARAPADVMETVRALVALADDARSAERERLATERRLRYLCQHDGGWASFYRGRLAHFVARTHFDGYRLATSGVLRALVGGDCRYGGADGLCGVGHDYDSAHLLARFVVLHRQWLS